MGKNIQIGQNYAVVMGLLRHNPKKLFTDIKKYNDFIFSEKNLQERKQELAEVFDQKIIEIENVFKKVREAFQKVDKPYIVITLKDDAYPELLKKVSMPPVVLWLRGDINLFTAKAISVVGSRTPSEDGIKRAVKLAYLLSQHGFTVVSGLAKGIDANAHNGAIKAGGKTIGVIGTPLNIPYPKENELLQEKIAESHLLVSQFPFSQQVSPYNFPARNYTMCGLSRATIIVEASERSGALIQARFCFREGRKLFVLKSLLERKDLTWPQHYVKQGAIVLEKIEDVEKHLDEIQQYKVADADTIQKQLELFDSPTEDE